MRDYWRDVVDNAGDDAWSAENVARTRERLADLLGARPNEIAFTKNTTEGLNIAAHGFDLRPGDNVLLTDLEHVANVWVWKHWEAKGVELRYARNVDGRLPLEAFLEKWDARTRVVSTAYVTYGNGYRVNLPELMRQPGFAGLQHYWMTPWFDDVRFGRWDAIRDRPNPAPDLPYVTAIWHYAQGMAAVRTDRLDDARKHHEALAKLAADPIMDTLLVWDRYPLAHAARVALGPELPAIYSTPAELAAEVRAIGERESDPMWQLPLWAGYDDELSSRVADLNNVSSSAFAGSILGALFLKRFVSRTRNWLHADVYAWNPKERPGRPVGADPHIVRALYRYIRQRFG